MKRIAFLAFLTSIVLVNQRWVGGLTIYSADVIPTRLAMHEAILKNDPPGAGTWGAVGADGCNVRVLTVYAAEAARVATGLSIHKVYQAIDLVFLMMGLGVTFAFFRSFVPEAAALLGLAYLGCILPLTYFQHAFHPWDRPSLFCWAVMLMLLRRGRVAAFAVVYVLSILVKYDCLFLPALLLALDGEPGSKARRAAAAVALMVVGLAEFEGLCRLFPGGFDSRPSVPEMLASNWRQLQESHIGYAPLLVFTTPGLLALIGYRRGGKFARGCAALGALLLLGPFLLRTNFGEVRAEIPCLLLLMPLALIGLQVLLEIPDPPPLPGESGSSSDVLACGDPLRRY